MTTFPFNDIPGLLSAADKIALRDLSAKCRHLPGVYVELGSYFGLSALCIAAGLDFARTLFCYDLFETDKLAEFQKNTERENCVPVVIPIVGDFRDTLKVKEICFAFVDADHSIETTKAAWDMIFPRLVKGGIILFHDVGHPSWPESSEYVQNLPQQYRCFEGLGLMAFKKP